MTQYQVSGEIPMFPTACWVLTEVRSQDNGLWDSLDCQYMEGELNWAKLKRNLAFYVEPDTWDLH